MADTVVDTETVTPEAPKNDATTVATPVVNATDSAEVERLKKEAEQAKMEANMLRNKLKAEEDAKAAAEAERLKENQQFKDLYEQTDARLREVEREREADARKRELAELKAKTLGEFSGDVKAAAEELGLDLTDVTDEALQEFRGKLDRLNTRVGGQKVSANNPAPASNGAGQMSQVDMYLTLNDPKKRDEYYRKKGGLTAQMMEPERP